MSYGKDLKQRVLNYLVQGGSRVEASNLFCVARSTIYRWEKGKNKGIKPGPKASHKIDKEELLHYMDKHKDAYLREIATHFQVSLFCVHYNLRKLDITRKKRRYTISKALSMKKPVDGI